MVSKWSHQHSVTVKQKLITQQQTGVIVDNENDNNNDGNKWQKSGCQVINKRYFYDTLYAFNKYGFI